MPLTLTAGKRDLVLDPVWTNAAGSLGFSDEANRFLELARLGALVTAPISLAPRSAARGVRLLPFQGGFLLHTGHPNPGLNAVLHHHRRRWQNLPCPVIVHMLAASPDEAARIADRLEPLDEVAALEIGLAEPEPDEAAAYVAACAAAQKPVLALLAVTSPLEVIRAAASAGAAAVVLGAPRGELTAADGTPVQGRLYGPAILPLTLRAIRMQAGLVGCPLIAGAGIYSPDDMNASLAAGAAAVQFDTVLWTEPERVLGGPAPVRGALHASDAPG